MENVVIANFNIILNIGVFSKGKKYRMRRREDNYIVIDDAGKNVEFTPIEFNCFFEICDEIN